MELIGLHFLSVNQRYDQLHCMMGRFMCRRMDTATLDTDNVLRFAIFLKDFGKRIDICIIHVLLCGFQSCEIKL